MNYITDINDEETNILIKRIKSDDKEAKELLIKKYYKLIKKFTQLYNKQNVPFEDIFQDACIGFLTAADKYDFNKNIKFVTYAFWWMRHEIFRDIKNKANLIRLPYNTKLFKLKYIYDRYCSQYKFEPTDEELRELYLRKYKNDNITIKQIKYLKTYFRKIVSLNTIIYNSEGNCIDELINILRDYNNNTEEDAIDNVLYENIRQILYNETESQLTESEKEVLKYRYGYFDGDIHTLEDTGKRLGFTKDRIRRIEFRALNKMRAHKKLLIKK